MKIDIFNISSKLIKKVSGVAVLLYLALALQPVCAEIVEVKLPSGLTALASFHKGVPNQIAVLILPGFLQTHQSLPMSALADNLASKGYTVLSPTISLGINRRSQTMACEAVHTHTMEQDVAEVDYWVKWLLRKGHQSLVMIGFSSTGNHEILEYVAQGAHPEIKKTILTSLNPIFTDPAEHQNALAAAKENKSVVDKNPVKFSLGYCKNNFAATTSSYFSYAKYDESRILNLVGHSPIPGYIFLGSADSILPNKWSARLKDLKSTSQIVVINNANHFFDGTNEFDLTEQIENILEKLPAK